MMMMMMTKKKYSSSFHFKFEWQEKISLNRELKQQSTYGFSKFLSTYRYRSSRRQTHTHTHGKFFLPFNSFTFTFLLFLLWFYVCKVVHFHFNKTLSQDRECESLTGVTCLQLQPEIFLFSSVDTTTRSGRRCYCQPLDTDYNWVTNQNTVDR